MKIVVTSGSGSEVVVDSAALSAVILNSEFVYFYDAAEVAEDDLIHPQDWAVPALLQAPFRRFEPFRLLRGPSDRDPDGLTVWQTIERQLAEVKPAWRLDDVRANARFRTQVERLLDVTMATNFVGSAIATKLLHKKRPNLIPIVDQELWAFYKPGGGLRSADDGRSAYHALSPREVTDLAFGQVRRDLLRQGNRFALEKVGETVASRGAPVLTTLRILELTIWLVRQPGGMGLVSSVRELHDGQE